MDTDQPRETEPYHDPDGVTDSPVVSEGSRKLNREICVKDMLTRKENPSKRQRALSDSPAGPGSKDDQGQGQVIVTGLTPGALLEIQKLIDASTRTILTSFQKKFESLEKKTEILEGELHGQHIKIQRLEKELNTVKAEKTQLEQQVESMDVNRRMNSLILKCNEFGPPQQNEEIEEKVVKVVTERFPDMEITTRDLQTCHRLQTEGTVICKFLQTKVRDQLYSKRIILAKAAKSGRDTRPPLFINESLTTKNRELFRTLLEAKRRGKVYSVFTRKGVPFYKTEPEGRNIRLDDAEQLRDLRRPADQR